MDTDRAVDIIAERLPLASKVTAKAILDDLRAAGIHLANQPCPYVVVSHSDRGDITAASSGGRHRRRQQRGEQ